MSDVMILNIKRTPVCKMNGQFSKINEQTLAAKILTEIVSDSKVKADEIDEIILGVSRQTSTPSNCARHAMLIADLPESVPAYTVNRQSASSMQAIANAFWKIKCGNARIIIAGGTENMSLVPYEIKDARFKFDNKTNIIFDPISEQIKGAQPISKYHDISYSSINENISKKYSISYEDQKKYIEIKKEKNLVDNNVVAVLVKNKKVENKIESDEPYEEIDIIAQPADAAAACLMTSKEMQIELNAAPIGAILSVGISAGDPNDYGLLCIDSVIEVLKKSNINFEDVSVIELHELTASQCIASLMELSKLGRSVQELKKITNIQGGSIHYGNPWGAAGSLLLHQALTNLKAIKEQYGLIICPVEGGQTMALVIQNL